VYTFTGGDKYLGEWMDGLKHGPGTYVFAGDSDRSIEQGAYYPHDRMWIKGKPTVPIKPPGVCTSGSCTNGRGVFAFTSGAEFDGQWQDGSQHGQGVLTARSGDKFVGQWQDGKEHGTGVLTTAGGAVFGGAFNMGELTSLRTTVSHSPPSSASPPPAVLTFATGHPFESRSSGTEVVPTKRAGVCSSGSCTNGRGMFSFGSGARYYGEWKDGKEHGTGVLTTADGAVLTGAFIMGRLQLVHRPGALHPDGDAQHLFTGGQHVLPGVQ
jgi:hypothetical protein